MLTAYDIKHGPDTYHHATGAWTPARPCGDSSIWIRLRDTWPVLSGRAVAVRFDLFPQ